MTQQVNDNKRIAYNTVMLYIRMLFLVLISLYTSRIVLQVLGIEDFGLNNVVGGIISFLGFMTSSLAGASSRFITFALGKGDFNNLKTTFNNIISIHILFAIIILIIGETLGLWFIQNKLNIPEGREIAAFWVYQFSIITAMGSFICMPFTAVIIAHEKMSTFAYLTLGDALLKLLAVYILTMSPYDKLIIYSGMIMLIQLCDIIIYTIYCYRQFPETHTHKLKIESDIFKEIFIYAGWTMNGNLAVFGYTQGLNILLNIFFNPIINAARGIAVQVQTVVNNFSYNFQMAINPQLTKNYAHGNYKRMHTLIITSSKFSIYLLYIICLPLSLKAETILNIWLTEVPEHTISFLRIILMTTILCALSNPIVTSIHATGKLKKFQIIEGSLLLLIVPISYLTLKFFNVPPESVFIIHFFIEIITQYARVKIVLPMINMKLNIYLKKVILPIIKTILLGTLIPFIVNQYIGESIISLFCICTISFLSIISAAYIVGCSLDEKKTIKSKFLQIINRFNP